MSWFLVDLGAHDEGLDFARRALDFAQREQDSYAEVLAQNALGRTLTLMGRNADAANCFAAARVICDRDGYDAIKAHLAGRMATALSRSGRPEEALRIVEDCLRQGLHFRTGQLEVFCLRMGHAEALFTTGDRDRGFGELEAAIDLARRIDSPVMLAEALGLRARLVVEAAPDDPRIGADLAEQAEIWRRHGFTSRRMDAPAISTAPAGP
jgi:tetratricopeptide (TPR) repeat protein